MGTGIDSGGHIGLRSPSVWSLPPAPAVFVSVISVAGGRYIDSGRQDRLNVGRLLWCGHVEPAQAGSRRPDTGDAVPITPICVHPLTLP